MVYHVAVKFVSYILLLTAFDDKGSSVCISNTIQFSLKRNALKNVECEARIQYLMKTN